MDKELFDVKEMNNLVEICLEVDSHWQIDMYLHLLQNSCLCFSLHKFKTYFDCRKLIILHWKKNMLYVYYLVVE